MKQDIEDELRKVIGHASRVAVLGIGNDLRTDDGVGPYVVSHLDITHPHIMVENVGSIPEAFAHPLAEFGAQCVILIDAADMRKEPGHIELVSKDRIGGVAISTHSMPLSFLMEYLEQESGAQVVLLGIQPRCIEFGEGLTVEVEDAAKYVVRILRTILTGLTGGADSVQDD